MIDISINNGYCDWHSVRAQINEFPASSTFEYTFNHQSVEKLTFQLAADHTAQMLHQECSNIYLGLSGGLDSEFVAEVLWRNGIPFTPIVAVLPDDIDHFYALHWCQTKSIQPLIINFNRNDARLLNESIKAVHILKQKTNLTSVNLYLEKYVRSIGGQFVTGDSPLLQHTDNFYQAAGPVFDIHWLVYTGNLIDRDCTSQHFLLYTPEILLAAATEIDYTLNDSAGKAKLYGIPYRPKNYHPSMPLDPSTEQHVRQLASADKYSRLSNAEWHRDELIKLLSR